VTIILGVLEILTIFKKYILFPEKRANWLFFLSPARRRESAIFYRAS
jgi:hypothetical protein